DTTDDVRDLWPVRLGSPGPHLLSPSRNTVRLEPRRASRRGGDLRTGLSTFADPLGSGQSAGSVSTPLQVTAGKRSGNGALCRRIQVGRSPPPIASSCRLPRARTGRWHSHAGDSGGSGRHLVTVTMEEQAVGRTICRLCPDAHARSAHPARMNVPFSCLQPDEWDIHLARRRGSPRESDQRETFALRQRCETEPPAARFAVYVRMRTR